MSKDDIEDDDSNEIPQIELFNRIDKEDLKHSKVGFNDSHPKQGSEEEDDAYWFFIGHDDGDDDHDEEEDVDENVGALELFLDDICYIEIEGVILIVYSHKTHQVPYPEYSQCDYLQHQYSSRRWIRTSVVLQEAMEGTDEEDHQGHHDIQ